MNKDVRILTRAEVTETGLSKLSQVADFGSGKEVAIPINPDGSIKWFDDTKLIRK